MRSSWAKRILEQMDFLSGIDPKKLKKIQRERDLQEKKDSIARAKRLEQQKKLGKNNGN